MDREASARKPLLASDDNTIGSVNSRPGDGNGVTPSTSGGGSDTGVRRDAGGTSGSAATTRSLYTSLVSHARSCFGELAATAIFVFVGTASVQTGNGLLIAAVHGLTITLLIAAFGDISGAHINPAVTFGVVLATDAIHWAIAVPYVVSQLTGAILGAALTRGVLSYADSPTSNQTVYEKIHGGSHTLAPGVTVGQGVLFEVVLTFALVQTVLMVACVDQSPWRRLLAPVAVGLAVMVDIAISGNITGGSMNPARSFGPAVVVNDLYPAVWTDHYVYWVGPGIGALLAVLFFRLMHGGRNRNNPVAQADSQASLFV